MTKYNYRTSDNQPCRHVRVPLLLTQAEEIQLAAWAERRGQTLTEWLAQALLAGIRERSEWERFTDGEEDYPL